MGPARGAERGADQEPTAGWGPRVGGHQSPGDQGTARGLAPPWAGLGPGPGGQEEVRVSGVRDVAQRSSEARLEGFLEGAFWQASAWRSGVGALRLYVSAPFLRGHS